MLHELKLTCHYKGIVSEMQVAYVPIQNKPLSAAPYPNPCNQPGHRFSNFVAYVARMKYHQSNTQRANRSQDDLDFVPWQRSQATKASAPSASI